MPSQEPQRRPPEAEGERRQAAAPPAGHARLHFNAGRPDRHCTHSVASAIFDRARASLSKRRQQRQPQQQRLGWQQYPWERVLLRDDRSKFSGVSSLATFGPLHRGRENLQPATLSRFTVLPSSDFGCSSLHLQENVALALFLFFVVVPVTTP